MAIAIVVFNGGASRMVLHNKGSRAVTGWLDAVTVANFYVYWKVFGFEFVQIQERQLDVRWVVWWECSCVVVVQGIQGGASVTVIQKHFGKQCQFT